MNIFHLNIAILTAASATLLAQLPNSSAQQGNAPPQSSSSNRDHSKKQVDEPYVNFSNELISWDGKSWKIDSERIFRSRFERYLNSPADDSAEYKEYSAIIRDILNKLAPSRTTKQSVSEAFEMLFKAANFEADGNLSEVLATQVYVGWMANREVGQLRKANQNLAEDRKRHEWNAKMSAGALTSISEPRRNYGSRELNKDQVEDRKLKRDVTMAPHLTRLAEAEALSKKNDAEREVSAARARLEFQQFIIEQFMHRRFMHVLMATRFYRAIFSDGTDALQANDRTKNLFSMGTGMPPTVISIEALANEAIRETNEGIAAFRFLVDKDELNAAAQRLSESFLIGEFIDSVRTLPREEKRKVLKYTQQANQLKSALEVKDYTLAEQLVGELENTAKDFDNSKPLAAIQTAKTIAAMHLAKAKNAAVSGDKALLESELKEATALWPRNPALIEVSGIIFTQSDSQQRILVDFDQMYTQRNYRGIWDDRVRFIAGTSTDPVRQKQLQEVLEQVGEVEQAIASADAIEKRGDSAGAWESVEKAFAKHPQDNKLNMMRADLTTKAADFVRALRKAEELEKKKQFGSSLAWFLKAQAKYPMSDYAREGIDRVKMEILPDAG